ncbi:hypothetical protein D9613_006139 [Agrocybe pediades]|uniref:Methyltransferase domain-containing protein n=1 Tax=Agrocybe pediades TaxID=84607 RepID=A0A8H4VNP1_9AGAR|nr:hypothetical protein D9613_006139 [Agrocybe pediades]
MDFTLRKDLERNTFCLDIVPLHPNLHNLGSSDLASRVTWVQHNFLETLPFQDEEFDFVHIKRIALGVPEDRWDSLLEEIARVMKPGGALEMIEEDLFFPGKQDDEDDEQPIRNDDDSLNWRKSVSSDQRTYRQHHESIDATMHTNGHQEAVVAAAVPSTPTDESHDSAADQTLFSDQVKNGQAISRPASAATYTPRSAVRRSESMNRPSLSVNTQNTTVSPEAYTNIVAAQPSMFSSNVGLFGGIGYLASEDPLMEALKKQKRDRTSTGHPEPASERVSFSGTVTITPKPKQKISPFLLRSMADDDCPTDPRDHTILAAVWTGMLGSRFINTSPLSLLTTFLDYHFKDVRTHPPLLYHYPPPYPKVDPHYDDGLWRQRIPAGESEYDIDDAKDAIRPSPGLVHPSKPRQSMASSADPTTDPSPESEDHRVSLKKLLKNPSPYVSLDNARSDAYVPSHSVLDGAPSARPKTNLPNQTLNIDLRTLNLHLSIRAKEILACSEEMWEWVEEVQLAEKMKDEEKRFKGTNEHHLGGLSDSASISSSVEFTNSAILDMTREDFDALLLNFHIDMMDRVAVGHLLKSRYDWHIFPDPKEKNGGISSERKAYDTNCAKYDAWLAKKGQNAPTASSWRRSMDIRSHSGLVVVPPKHDTSETNSPTISTADHSFADGHSISSTLIGSSTRSEHNSSQLVPPGSPTATKVCPAPQQKMLSRAMRVFVAWKAT